MSLLLVQHGKSLPKEEDPQRGLSAEGRKEVEQVASTLKKHGVAVSSIQHSGKKRARETAEIFSSYLGTNMNVIEMNGLAPLDDVTRINPPFEENTMMVGHLPFMERFVSFLVAGSPDHLPVVKFKNGGIVALAHDDETGGWYIKWTLFPNIEP